MKKNILLFFLSFVLLGGWGRAQVPITIPNSSFEQWTSHNGYSVTVLFVPISVYDTFSTPSVWNYPSYPVNESVSMMGMNININTSIPLVRAYRETSGVPDGNKAVKLQSFMLGDIVNSMVLNLAGNYIDSSLTSQVIPSILSTGAIDIEAFIPILTDLMSGTGDLFTLLPSLLTLDVNDYITGGIALGNYRPGRLTGSYKYHSAVSGDNGGVVMIGTRYNTATHHRDIVGGGFNLDLFDANVYTPFEVEYQPLSALVPGSTDHDPDSLIVLLLSSAGNNMQQGSYLCLDNLMLWSAPDTCADITASTAVPYIHEAMLSWSISDPADSFELEYGPAGFTLGSGTTATTTATSITLDSLESNTAYDVHIRTLCSDTVYGDWSTLQFSTLNDTCSSIIALAAVSQIHEAELSWNVYGTVEGFEIEYGPAGFTLGNGDTLTTTTTTLTLSGLDASTAYDVYVRTLCANSIYGNWSTLRFTTHGDTCASVIDLMVDNPVRDGFPENVLTWSGSSQPDHWEVEYGPQDFQLGTGTVVVTSDTYFEIYPLEQNNTLNPNTWYDFYVRPVCQNGIYGDWDSVHYLTPCAKVSGLTAHGSGDELWVSSDNRIGGLSISWTDSTDTQSWGVYYGIYSTEFPDSWGTYVTVDTPYFEFPPLLPERTYSVEVSARCAEDNYGDIVWINFTTPGIEGIDDAPLFNLRHPLSVSPNPANGQCTVTTIDNEPADMKLYSIDGRLIQTVTTDGTPVILDLPWQGIYLLQATNSKGVATCKIVNQ